MKRMSDVGVLGLPFHLIPDDSVNTSAEYISNSNSKPKTQKSKKVFIYFKDLYQQHNFKSGSSSGSSKNQHTTVPTM